MNYKQYYLGFSKRNQYWNYNFHTNCSHCKYRVLNYQKLSLELTHLFLLLPKQHLVMVFHHHVDLHIWFFSLCLRRTGKVYFLIDQPNQNLPSNLLVLLEHILQISFHFQSKTHKLHLVSLCLCSRELED